VKPDKANARRVIEALESFGLGASGLEKSDLEALGEE
jgi:hypothetical protein